MKDTDHNKHILKQLTSVTTEKNAGESQKTTTGIFEEPGKEEQDAIL